ncbi:MAG: hypothetical protein HSCHL_2568 [Hydrogenibacillus schlegelii]|uniref:SLH domain-containing protein n=3 Tax=Hydrogenibacillus TaxID=1609627 RepID=A0A2T5G3P8_HYDSH|nr:MAG: hypothetical protein HSCHL_2568 [Hydrogenibacillus schlegelii]
MAGDGQTFRPNAPITREEMAVVLVNALGMKDEAAGKAPTFADSASISAWARGAVGLAQEKGLIRGVGDNRFAPKANAKRAEAAALLYNVVFQSDSASQDGIAPLDATKRLPGDARGMAEWPFFGI